MAEQDLDSYLKSIGADVPQGPAAMQPEQPPELEAYMKSIGATVAPEQPGYAPKETDDAEMEDWLKGIARVETRGQADPYKARNAESSAVGKYQFIWNFWGEESSHIKKFAKNPNLTIDDFINNPELQENYVRFYYKDQIVNQAKNLENRHRAVLKQRNIQDVDDVRAILHFRGFKDTEYYLKTGIDPKKATEKNKTIEQYLAEFRQGRDEARQQRQPTPVAQAMKAQAEPKDGGPLEAFALRKDYDKLKAELSTLVPLEERKKLDQPIIYGGHIENVREKRIMPSEFEALARKHNVKASDLKPLAAFFGTPAAEMTVLETLKQTPQFIAGELGEIVTGGIPQKLLIEAQSDPRMLAALDDLRTLAENKKGWVQRGAEIAGGFMTGTGIVKGAAKLATVAGAGKAATQVAKAGAVATELAAFGAAQAESGKEVAGAVTSLAFGGALLGGAKLAGEVVGAGRTLAARASKKLQDANPNFVEQATAKAAEKFQGVDTILNNAVIRNTSITGEDLKDGAKLAEKLGSENVSAIAEHVQKTRPAMIEVIKENLDRVGQASPEKIAEEATRWFTENSVRQVALETFGSRIPYRQGDVLKTVRTMLNKTEDVSSALGRMRVSQEVRSQVRQGNYKAMPEVASSLKRMGDVVMGSRYTAEAIDRRHGTKLQPLLDTMSRKFNEFHAYVRPKAEEVSGLIKQTRETDMTTEQLYEKLDKGGSFGDEAKDAILQSWRKFFSDAADDAGTLGVQIQKRKNYVPYAIKPQEELYATLKGAAEEFRTKHGIDLLNQELSIEQIKEFRKMGGMESDLLRSLDILSGDQKAKNYSAKLLGVLNDSKTGGINRVISARALERTGEELPSLIKDQDVGRLAQRWLESTFKSGTLRDSIAELRTASNIMRSIGDKRANKYLNNLVADLTGMPRDGGLGRELAQVKANMAANLADKALEAKGAQKLVYSGIQSFTDAMPLMYNSMYANALGFSPRQAIANLSALATQTIPELGYAFGTGLASKAMVRALNDVTFGKEIIVKSPAVAKKLGVEIGSKVNTRSMRLALENEGLASSQWNENIERSIANSMKKTWKGQVADSTIKGYAKLGMAMFEATETIYRTMAVDMAKQVAKAYEAGGPEALKFADTLPRSYRQLLDKAKDSATKEKLLTDYIIGKTVYNYNQASASEIGRSLGPFLSSFTKWPTEQLGDTVNTFAKNGVTAGTADFLYRRMVPLATLMMLDSVTGWREDPETAFLITGKRGMQSWAPVNSLKSIFEGDVAPPIVSIPAGVAAATLKADPEALAKTTTDAAKIFIPGSKVVNIVTEALEAFE